MQNLNYGNIRLYVVIWKSYNIYESTHLSQ
jgi:hypothetical protein